MKLHWHEIATKEQLSLGEHKAVLINEHPVAVFHLKEGYYAIEDVCSHQGLPLSEGLIDDAHIRCPFHGAEFCIKTGKALSLPAHDNIKTYATKVEKGIIYIGTETI